jgi:hypothetical protein
VSSGAHLHQFAPALEDEERPDARPAYRIGIPEITMPEAADGLGRENACGEEAIVIEGFIERAAPLVAEPMREGKREGAFGAGAKIVFEAGRKERAGGIEEKPLAVETPGGWESESALDDLAIEEDGAKFEAVGHAHDVAIAEEARLEMSGDVHGSYASQEIAMLGFVGAGAEMFDGGWNGAIFRDAGRKIEREITLREEYANG